MALVTVGTLGDADNEALGGSLETLDHHVDDVAVRTASARNAASVIDRA